MKRLESSIRELNKIYSQTEGLDAKKQEIQGHMQDLEREMIQLERRRDSVERDITVAMIDKHQKLDNPVLDYCARHFISGEGALQDYVDKVHEFITKMKKFEGQQILTEYTQAGQAVPGEKLLGRNSTIIPSEAGIVHEKCRFVVNNTFRYLYVPVFHLATFNKEHDRWSEGRREYDKKSKKSIVITDLLWVPDQIFGRDTRIEYDKKDGMIFTTDNSMVKILGRKRPAEIKLYVGKPAEEKLLKSYLGAVEIICG